MRVLIVVPAQDDVATIGTIVAQARAHGPVLVVDDGSTDGTGETAARAGAEVQRHPRRLGKAQATRTGIAVARRRGASAIVTLAGDGRHDPSDLPALLEAARETPGTILIATRSGGERDMPPERRNALRIAAFFVTWASGLAVRDPLSDFRLYPLSALDALVTRRGGPLFETEVLCAAAARGMRVREVRVGGRRQPLSAGRVQPAADGLAIASFVAGRAVGRFSVEASAAAWAVGAVFRRDRRQARHQHALEAAAPWADSVPLWGLAVGAAIAGRAGARLAVWWRHPRRRRATLAARATAALPVAVPLVLLQALAGGRAARWMDRLTGRLVERLYPADGLDAPARRASPAEAPLAPETVAPGP